MNQVSALVCPVNSHNEWDPLEEVIVGTLDGAMFPEWNTINLSDVRKKHIDRYKTQQLYSQFLQ